MSYLMACCLMLVAGMPTASEPKPTSPSLTRPASRTKMRPASVTCGTHTRRKADVQRTDGARAVDTAVYALPLEGLQGSGISRAVSAVHACCALGLPCAYCWLPELCCVRTSPHTCPDASSACAANRLSTRAAWRARSLPIWWTAKKGTHMCFVSNYRCSKCPHTCQALATQSARVLHAALLHDVLPARWPCPHSSQRAHNHSNWRMCACVHQHTTGSAKSQNAVTPLPFPPQQPRTLFLSNTNLMPLFAASRAPTASPASSRSSAKPIMALTTGAPAARPLAAALRTGVAAVGKRAGRQQQLVEVRRKEWEGRGPAVQERQFPEVRADRCAAREPSARCVKCCCAIHSAALLLHSPSVLTSHALRASWRGRSARSR